MSCGRVGTYNLDKALAALEFASTYTDGRDDPLTDREQTVRDTFLMLRDDFETRFKNQATLESASGPSLVDGCHCRLV